MTNCIVLGGNGLIGSHIVEQLVDRGCNVKVFDRFTGKNKLQVVDCKIERVEGDYLKRQDVKRALKNIDVLFHSIHTTVPSTSIQHPLFDAKTNILPAIRLLQDSIYAGVKKFIYLSSIAVYGAPERIPIKETDPPKPVSPYGLSKLAIEKYIEYFGRVKGLDYVILRASATYGERQSISSESGVVVNFIYNAKRKKQISIYGDGSTLRDLTHAEDIARGAVKAALEKTRPRLFNLGTGGGVTLNQLAERVETITGNEVRIKYKKNRGDVKNHVFDVSRANKMLGSGWKATISIDDGIRRCYEELLKRD
ncbi:NAD-dependent epimerase/dehydratase family protein [Thermodesulfobacteriota bacterium]